MNPKRKVGEKCNVYCEYQKNGICHTYGDAYKLCEKRKVGKSCLRCRFNHENYCSIVDIKDWHCSQRNGFKYFEPQPEVKKSCATCFDKYYKVLKIQVNDPASKIDPYMRGMANGLILGYCMITGREPHYIEKPRQEEKIVYYCPVDSAYRDFVCGDKEGIAKCTAKKYIIFKECNQPFKIIKVEEK